jgi:hypothetical protein
MDSPTSPQDDHPQTHEVAEPAGGTASMTPAAIESQVSWAEDLHRRLSERLGATAEQ